MIFFLLVLQFCTFTLATHRLPSREFGILNRRFHSWRNLPRRKAILLSINSRPVFTPHNPPPTFKFPIRSDFTKGDEDFSKVTMELPIYKAYDFKKHGSKAKYVSWFNPAVDYTTFYNPSKPYEPPIKPSDTYGPPTKVTLVFKSSQKTEETHKPCEEHVPPKKTYEIPVKPAETYGPPKKLCETFELPIKPAEVYGPPERPFKTYEVPAKPVEVYGPPPKPAETYGPPKKLCETFELPIKPAEVYGPPERPFETYELPIKPAVVYGPPEKPFDTYGPPVKPAETYGPPTKPAEIYGPPKKPYEVYELPETPAETYGPPKKDCERRSDEDLFSPTTEVKLDYKTDFSLPVRPHVNFKKENYWFSPKDEHWQNFDSKKDRHEHDWQTPLWENSHSQYVPTHSSLFDGNNFDIHNLFNENNYHDEW